MTIVLTILGRFGHGAAKISRFGLLGEQFRASFERSLAIFSDFERFCGDFKAFAVLDSGLRMTTHREEG